MLTCTSCRTQIAAYLDDLLAPRQRAEVAAHLEECEACARYCKGERALGFAVRDLKPTAPPPELRGRVRAAIHAERQQATASHPSWLSLLTGRSAGMIWAGGLSVAACGLLFLVQNHPETQETVIHLQHDVTAEARTSAAMTTAPHEAATSSPAPHSRPAAPPAHIAGVATHPAPAPIQSEPRRHRETRVALSGREMAPAVAPAPRPAIASPVRPVTKPSLPATAGVTPAQAHLTIPVATARTVVPDIQPTTPDTGLFVASAEWVEKAATAGGDGGMHPDALLATRNAVQGTGGAPRAIKLKFTPARDLNNAQLRAILPKSEEGKADGAEEVVWFGDATAHSPIAIRWEPPVNSARTNVNVTLVLEQLDADGKASPVQTQQVEVGAAPPAAADTK